MAMANIELEEQDKLKSQELSVNNQDLTNKLAEVKLDLEKKTAELDEQKEELKSKVNEIANLKESFDAYKKKAEIEEDVGAKVPEVRLPEGEELEKLVEDSEKHKKAEQEIKNMFLQLESKEEEIKNQTNQIKEIQSKVEAKDEEIKGLSENVKTKETSMNDLTTKISGLNKDIDKLNE